VVITVDTSKLAVEYTITLSTATGANINDGSLTLEDWGIDDVNKAVTVKVEKASASSPLTTKQGVPYNPANIKVTIAATAPASITAGYDYTITIPKLNNAKVVLNSGTANGTLSVGAVTLTDNMTITKDDVKIECTKMPLAIVADKCSWTATTMTIVFNQAVNKAEAEDYTSGNTPYTFAKGGISDTPVIGDASLSEDGTTVTLTFASGELSIPSTGNAPKVTVDGTKLKMTDGKTAFSAITADDVSIAADGKVSVA